MRVFFGVEHSGSTGTENGSPSTCASDLGSTCTQQKGITIGLTANHLSLILTLSHSGRLRLCPGCAPHETSGQTVGCLVVLIQSVRYHRYM
jgi:hypothetical protein